MAVINSICECGNAVLLNVGDCIRNDILYWFLSYRCENCGKAVEVDGTDKIPERIKKAIVEQEGLWGLFFTDNKELARIKYILKKEPNVLSKLSSHNLSSNVTTNMLYEGTNNEMILLYNYMSGKGIKGLVISNLLY